MREKQLGVAAVVGVLVIVIYLMTRKGSEEDKEFYLISGFSGEGVNYFVNGNPTNRGHALTLFLVDGKNKIELRGDLSEVGYHVIVSKGTRLFGEDGGGFGGDFQVHAEEERVPPEAAGDGVLEFEAEIDQRWVWRDADELVNFSRRDRKTIYEIYDRICDFLEGESFNPIGIINRDDVVLWDPSHDALRSAQKSIAEISEKIPPRSELVFTKAKHEDLRVLTGKQLVMLSCDERYLVRLGEPENEEPSKPGEWRWTYSYSLSQMFFAKFDGTWKVMLTPSP